MNTRTRKMQTIQTQDKQKYEPKESRVGDWWSDSSDHSANKDVNLEDVEEIMGKVKN